MKRHLYLAPVLSFLLFGTWGCGQNQTDNTHQEQGHNATADTDGTDQITDADDSQSDALSDDTHGPNGTDHGDGHSDALSDDSPDSHSDHQSTDDPDEEYVPTDAEEIARNLIAGKISSHEAFRKIDQGTGFPVVTNKNTVIFMQLCDNNNWYVAGDFNEWNWQQYKMSKTEDVCYIEIPIAASPSYYKFMQDNGQTKDYIADPYAQNYAHDKNGEISYLIAPSDKPYLKKWHIYPNAKSLLPRIIRAYIPGNYRSYDVIYAQDGQKLFGGGWNIEEAMAKIDGRFLVVGIDNTADRMNEYTHTDDTVDGYTYYTKGGLYAAFVNTEVRPFIESRFYVNKNAKRGLMGSSLGGLISLYIAHLYPDDYNMVLALSPTTAWGRFGNNTGTTIEDLYVEARKRSFVLYLDNGGKDVNAELCGNYDMKTANMDESDGANYYDNHCFTRHFVDTMANKLGYEWNKDLYHYHDKGPDGNGAGHNEAAWAYRVSKPMEIFKNLQQ